MKITLCGSTRFREQYEKLNRELSMAGMIVYSVSSFGHSGDPLTDDQKETLDLVHLRKITESEAIVVIGENEDGTPYVGNSTRREIKWANMLNIPVLYERDIWDGDKLREVKIVPGDVVERPLNPESMR